VKLKCWIGNLDGRRRGLVISTSKDKAREAIASGGGGRVSRAEFDGYWALQEDFYMRGLGALFKPDTLYTHEISHAEDTVLEWHEGRCKLSRT
jgi:hypothetical protein